MKDKNKTIQNIFQSDYFWLVLLIFLYLLTRFYNFSERFEFHFDASQLAYVGLNLWQQKDFVIGFPNFSLVFEGKHLFWSSLPTYIGTIFYILTSFQPKNALILYNFISALTIIPLYFGIKRFSNQNAALIVSIFYTLFPPFVKESLQIWPAHMQILIWPFVIYTASTFKKLKKNILLFATGFLSGIALHFQLPATPLVAIFGLIFSININLSLKKNLLQIFYFFSGVIIALSPFIIFELRNNFYNTFILSGIIGNVLNHSGLNNSNFGLAKHYYYPLYIFSVCAISILFAKKFNKIVILLFLFFMIMQSTQVISIKSKFPNNKPVNLSFQDEKMIYGIIKNKLKTIDQSKVNISHLPYDNYATVQKYFLKVDKVYLNWEEYYQNKFLFVTDNDGVFDEYTAYEISTFWPRKILERWKINSDYSLFLLERESSKK